MQHTEHEPPRADNIQKSTGYSHRATKGLAPDAPGSADSPMASRLTRAGLGDLITGGVLGVSAWILTAAPLLFSVNPLPLALLCAAPRYTTWILGGMLLSLWQSSPHPWLYAVSALLALLLRYLSPLLRAASASPAQHLRGLMERLRARGASQKAKADASPVHALFWSAPLDEPLGTRVLIALISALLPCLGVPLLGGFAYYDLYGAAFYLLLLPVAVVLFSHGLDGLRVKDPAAKSHSSNDPSPSSAKDAVLPSNILSSVGTAALFFSIVFCAREMSLLGISPSICLSVVLSLWLLRRRGLLVGACVALLGGLAYDVRLIPLYLGMVLIDAFLYPLAANFSMLPALLAAFLYTLLYGGSAMFWAVAPSLAVSVLIFSSIGKLAEHQKAKKEEPARAQKQNEVMCELLCEQSRNEALLKRISQMAGAFSNLSEVFRQLGDALSSPSATEIRHICDEVLDAKCPDCPNRLHCWSERYTDTVASIYELSRALASATGTAKSDLPEEWKGRCPHADELFEEITYRVARRRQDRLTDAERVRYAQTYDSISQLLRDLLREGASDGQSFRYSNDASLAVQDYFSDLNIHPRHVCVMGERRQTVQILGISPASLTVPLQQLREDLQRTLHRPLSSPRYDGSEDGRLTLHALPRLRADFVHRSSPALTKTAKEEPTRAKVGEKGGQANKKSKLRSVCGDTVRVFEGQDGMLYALLCDGMGSGKNAALTSGSCVVFLEQVLRTGVSIQTALRMLNHYLRSRSGEPEDEYSSTVDLFALDLYSGQARFVKSGAACSLVIRDGRLYRLASHTVPIGILQAIDAQVIPFDVRPGDRILMMSDGLTDTAQESFDTNGTGEMDTRAADDWLTEYLSEHADELQASSDATIDSPCTDDTQLIETLFSLARKHGSTDDISMISLRILEEKVG